MMSLWTCIEQLGRLSKYLAHATMVTILDPNTSLWHNGKHSLLPDSHDSVQIKSLALLPQMESFMFQMNK